MPDTTPVYSYGYQHSLNEPVYSSVSPEGWTVTNPLADERVLHFSGQMYWSSRFGQPFLLQRYIGSGIWDATFPEDWEVLAVPDIAVPEPENVFTPAWNTAPNTSWIGDTSNSTDTTIDISSIISEVPIEETLSEAEFTSYVIGRPFMYASRWYVVMANTEEAREWYYEDGQEHYCEYECVEFRLTRRVRPNLFGSTHSFRIEWLDSEDANPDYDVDDGYSVEEEDNSVAAISPQIATNIGREVPTVSFEQEFSGNGEIVARRLYEAGYALSSHAESYHGSNSRYHRFENDNDAFCYVETDSSCGYELIFDRLELRNRNQAERISQAQTILKGLKDEGHINLSARCGFHVHVDVSNWGMKEIVSAYHLWNYLEDPIFRFASAFWNSHRDEEVGGGYSAPVPKGHISRRDIGRVLDGRRDALNFSPILNARQNCTCSANMYEDWANCACNVSQPTLEFRVFNATLNQRKIKAYLAFCIAFVNKAKEIEFDPVNFPEMRWQSTTRKSSVIEGNTEKSWDDATIERVKFIINEFPLTGAEKGDINYCLRNSSLSSVMEWV